MGPSPPCLTSPQGTGWRGLRRCSGHCDAPRPPPDSAYLAQVEQKDFSAVRGPYFYTRLAAEGGAVTRGEAHAIGRHLPAGDMEPGVAPGGERVAHGIRRLEQRGPQ